MTTSAILHVGMPKCGSSALQTALSRHDETLNRRTSASRYVVLDSKGEILTGDALRSDALGTPSGYLASTQTKHLERFGPNVFDRLRTQLKNAVAGWDRLIMSNEEWGNEHGAFSQGRYLERLGLDCEIVLYVRPQVAWCNSAWWQWGAWKPEPSIHWVLDQLPRIQWFDVVKKWQLVPGVSKVTVRLLPENVIEDFCSHARINLSRELTSNTSLPASILRLYQRHRQLRPRPHTSANDFVLSRLLQLQGQTAPWVLELNLVKQILEECRDSNLQLLELLGESQGASMRDDPAWWSHEFYAARLCEPWQPIAPDANNLDLLAATALQALVDLDTQHRQLANEIKRAQE
jgi:hypothetical protein